MYIVIPLLSSDISCKKKKGSQFSLLANTDFTDFGFGLKTVSKALRSGVGQISHFLRIALENVEL